MSGVKRWCSYPHVLNSDRPLMTRNRGYRESGGQPKKLGLNSMSTVVGSTALICTIDPKGCKEQTAVVMMAMKTW